MPRWTTSPAKSPMANVHIDLAGPNQPSLGESIYLIMFIDMASRWVRPCGMASKAETAKSVNMFVAHGKRRDAAVFSRGRPGGTHQLQLHRRLLLSRDSPGVHRTRETPAECACRAPYGAG